LSTTSGESVAIGYVQLIRRNRNFRFLWFGQIISLLGDWFNLIASASLIALLTESGFAIGWLFVVRMLATFIASPIAGVIADRYNRKHILIATDIVRAVTVIGFLFVRNTGDVWLLYTLTAIQSGISGFFFPTRNAILPDIVLSRQLGAANALGSATWSVMQALGAAIGGLVAGIWGIYLAFVIDGFTFLISGVLIAQIRLRPRTERNVSDKTIGGVLTEYTDGLRYLGINPDILVIVLHKAAVGLLMFAGFQIALVKIAEEIFVIGVNGAVSMGLIYGVNGIGTGIGPIIARHFTGDRDKPLRFCIIVGYFLGAVGLIIIAPLSHFGFVLLGALFRGIGGGIVWVFSTQLLLHLTASEVRGRVFATEFALFTLMGAAASAIAGVALDAPSFGVSDLLGWMAGLILIPGVLWASWMIKLESKKM
jgi:MFS family permease